MRTRIVSSITAALRVTDTGTNNREEKKSAQVWIQPISMKEV
jgi:hypothetical protein